jgi:hypothetical protein
LPKTALSRNRKRQDFNAYHERQEAYEGLKLGLRDIKIKPQEMGKIPGKGHGKNVRRQYQDKNSYEMIVSSQTSIKGLKG